MNKAAHITPELSLKICVVDDEKMMRVLITRVLERCGCSVVAVAGVEEGLSTIATGDIDLVLSDLRMPGANGDDLLVAMTTYQPHIPVVMMSCEMSSERQQELLGMGAFACIVKPINKSIALPLLNRPDLKALLDR